MTTPLHIEKALLMVVQECDGMYDRDGMPKAFHPIRVASLQQSPLRIVAALLHDLVEDTDVTEYEIALKFGIEVSELVGVLTRGEDESWNHYISDILKNEDACHIKLADIFDNTRTWRMDRKAAEKMPMYVEAYNLIAKKLNHQPIP